MRCIYDSLVEPQAKTFKRYGMTYKLEKRTSKGDKTYFSFTAPGMEKLIVTPDFAKQYYEAQKIYSKFPSGKDLEFYMKSIKRNIDKKASSEEYPGGGSESGIIHVITALYKDIQVQFEFDSGELTMSDEFVIVKGNLFGTGETVLMTKNSEE